MSTPPGTPPAVPPADAGNTPPGGIEVDGKKFTQDEYNRHLAERSDRAKRSALDALEAEAKAAGFDSVAAMKEAALRAAQADKDRMSEMDKLKAELARSKSETESAKAAKEDALKASRLTLLRTAVMLEAGAQGVDPTEIPSVWKDIKDDEAAKAAITEGEGGELTGVKEVVAAVVKAHPRWLREAPVAPLGTPPGRTRQPAPPAVSEEEAKAKLRQSGSYAPV
jgi:hypothetical protein